MKEVRIYQNNRNEHKFILVTKYDAGHVYAQQFMKWKNGVSWMAAGVRHGRRLRRFRKGTLDMILADYTMTWQRVYD